MKVKHTAHAVKEKLPFLLFVQRHCGASQGSIRHQKVDKEGKKERERERERKKEKEKERIPPPEL